jgi:hypothetical protein
MKVPNPFWRLPALVVAALVLATGCDPGTGHLVAVHGKVSYQGTAVRRGTIVFTPDIERGASGPIARADIQPDGSYVLSTGDQPGAATGWYRVTITALEPGLAEAESSFQPARSYLPDRYRDPELSGLVCQVLDVPDNSIDFNLD